jgi:flagellin
VSRTGSVAVTATRAISDDEGVPTRGALRFAGDYVTPGVYQASFEALTGTIAYDGRTFDLDSVDYTGAVTATDYLTRLTTAALPVLGTPHTPFVGTALGLHFDGETPGAASTVADAELLSPSYRGRSGASAAIALVDRAVADVSSLRAYLGAVENRFHHILAGLDVMAENMTTSMSRIRDADIAQEMVTLSRHQIVAQAGTAMLSQANSAPRSLLSLLG